jgi:hypothetical protein
VHRISTKSLDIDTRILQDMPIEAVVVPYLKELAVLQVGLEYQEEVTIVGEVINE